MNVRSSFRARVDPAPVTALLAVGDVAAIGSFVLAGELSHGYDPVADAGRVVGTLIPFLAAWLVVSVTGGVYARDAVADLRSAVVRAIPSWAVAVVVAQLLRATAVFHGDAAVTFALVSFGVGVALLVAWRVLVLLVAPLVLRRLGA